jgi:hypothetical protein
LERDPVPTEHYIIGLEFTDLEFPGHHARFFGDMESVDPIPGLTWLLSTSRLETREFGFGGSVTSSQTETYSAVPIPGVSTFFMEGAKCRLPEGLHMSWRVVTLAAK